MPMVCTGLTLPAAFLGGLARLDNKYVNMLGQAEFMCDVRTYLVDDMLIGTYQTLVASQLGTALIYMSTVIMTIWVAYQGFMLISGENKKPVLPLIFQTGKMMLILSLVALIARQSPAIADAVLDFKDLITSAIVGDDVNLYQMIDINIALAQVFNALVDSMVGGQQAGADGKSLTTMAGLIGQSGPAMLVSVMALMAEISIVVAIMLSPLFIFFLLFQQTSSMFWTWAKFLLGTMVSLAVLTLLASILLDMMMMYGAKVVVAFFLNGMLSAAGIGGGFDIGASAMQLTALGGLSAALLMMIPPVVMQFFNSGASFAAGAMMGAMGGGAAGGAMGVAKQLGGQGDGGAAGGQGANGGMGAQGAPGSIGYNGGSSNMAAANNQALLTRANSMGSTGGYGGDVGGLTGSAGSGQGLRGLANKSSESPSLYSLREQQSSPEFRNSTPYSSGSGGSDSGGSAGARGGRGDRTLSAEDAKIVEKDSKLGTGGHLGLGDDGGSVGGKDTLGHASSASASRQGAASSSPAAAPAPGAPPASATSSHSPASTTPIAAMPSRVGASSTPWPKGSHAHAVRHKD